MTNKQSAQNNISVITSHINADFDAIASMLAAQKIYPEALIVFPGSHEKTIRNFYINTMVYLFNMVDIKDIDFNDINKLIIVDTRKGSRIGSFAKLLNNKDVEIHIYDHHPKKEGDITPDFEHSILTGANITILSEIIQTKKIHITPDEATIMCLGLYEDTGSFTFASTTSRDFISAAFLLSKGANLNIVSSLISKEISSQQISFLNELILAASTFKIYGIDIVISSISTKDYIPDFAVLVHKFMRMENIEALFAIGRMGNKIYIIARSQIPEVDVCNILAPFNGGGHAFAASASINNKTLAQVESQLIAQLHDKVKPEKKAKKLMSSPPISIHPETSCSKASILMTRYNINALLINSNIKNKKKTLSGFISRQVIEKALSHNLGNLCVTEFMTTEFVMANNNANLTEIQNKIIDNKQRILPIYEKDTIIGVITKNDLLNLLLIKSSKQTKLLPESAHDITYAKTRNVSKFIHERINKALINTLKKIGTTAFDLGFKAYIVGGFVRDLFLYKKNYDIDIVIEGDGIQFAKKYAAITKARVHCHKKFNTAVIIFENGFKIDIASARIEYYKSPAALPEVEMSSIKFDLFRRDFTINTLAIGLIPDDFGFLIDFFSAHKDLKDKVVRILHNLSFVEDPTRIFRAIKFEQRFNFSIGKLTSRLIHNAVKMDFFKRISGRRVFIELKQILEEDNPVLSIIRLNDYKLLQIIHPSITLNKKMIKLFDSIKEVLTWYELLFINEPYMKWVVYFLGLIQEFDKQTSIEICKNFEITTSFKKTFSKERFCAIQTLFWIEQNQPLTNSTLYHSLSKYKTELILYIMAKTNNAQTKKSISFYFSNLKNKKTKITGKDLKKLLITPGPVYKEILDAVLNAVLNKEIKSKKDEITFVKNYLNYAAHIVQMKLPACKNNTNK